MGLEEVTRRCFRIIPSDESTMKTFVFGCAKDGERKVGIGAFPVIFLHYITLGNHMINKIIIQLFKKKN